MFWKINSLFNLVTGFLTICIMLFPSIISAQESVIPKVPTEPKDAKRIIIDDNPEEFGEPIISRNGKVYIGFFGGMLVVAIGGAYYLHKKEQERNL